MIPEDREELDVLAGEYVLGVLDAEAAREVEGALYRSTPGCAVPSLSGRNALPDWPRRPTPPSRRPAAGAGSRRGSGVPQSRRVRAVSGIRLRCGAARPRSPRRSPPAWRSSSPRRVRRPSRAWSASFAALSPVSRSGSPRPASRASSLRAVSPAAAPDRRVFQLWAIAPRLDPAAIAGRHRRRWPAGACPGKCAASRRRHPGDQCRAPRRLAHRPTHRPGGVHRQAHRRRLKIAARAVTCGRSSATTAP